LLIVATITRSMSDGATPDFSIASIPAVVDRSIASVVGTARARVMMPVR